MCGTVPPFPVRVHGTGNGFTVYRPTCIPQFVCSSGKLTSHDVE
jgi:hypothetical protein